LEETIQHTMAKFIYCMLQIKPLPFFPFTKVISNLKKIWMTGGPWKLPDTGLFEWLYSKGFVLLMFSCTVMDHTRWSVNDQKDIGISENTSDVQGRVSSG
jgi:hypothetical protein